MHTFETCSTEGVFKLSNYIWTGQYEIALAKTEYGLTPETLCHCILIGVLIPSPPLLGGWENFPVVYISPCNVLISSNWCQEIYTYIYPEYSLVNNVNAQLHYKISHLMISLQLQRCSLARLCMSSHSFISLQIKAIVVKHHICFERLRGKQRTLKLETLLLHMAEPLFFLYITVYVM